MARGIEYPLEDYEREDKADANGTLGDMMKLGRKAMVVMVIAIVAISTIAITSRVVQSGFISHLTNPMNVD